MLAESALIVGVGGATGTSVARALSGRYRLGLVARSADVIGDLASGLDDAIAFECDVGDPSRWARALEAIHADLGTPQRVVFNVESAQWGDYASLDLDAFQKSFAVNVTGLLQLVQRLYPPDMKFDDVRVLISSSPAAYTPSSRFLGLAPARVAQRVLAELLDELLSPRGVGFSIFSIDGAIDEPKMRGAYPDEPTSFFIQPEDIAAAMSEALHGEHFPKRSGIRGVSSFSRTPEP